MGWGPATNAVGSLVDQPERRAARWRIFQIVFCFVYAGVVLDVITTRLGYLKSGSDYEQNPLGGSLIGHLGWIGLLMLLTILSWVCYRSVSVVFARMSLRWTGLIIGLMTLLAGFRWLAVVTSILYLLQPGK